VVFTSEPGLLESYKDAAHFTTRVYATSEMHTTISYENQFLLKLYRKVDKGAHPDAEITRYLSAAEERVPKYSGTIEWQLKDHVFVLGMLEKLEENHGNGHQYMLERLANYMERILARNRSVISAYQKKGTLTKPVAFEELEFELKEFMGGNAAEISRLTGKRLAQVHKALAKNLEKEFLPEEFSLHYQRSLFSGMSSVVREMGQAIDKNIGRLPPELQQDVAALNSKKQQLLTTLRRIYDKKFDVLKIRIHGNFGLSHILLTGRDIVLHDFGGNPLKPYSERRLKRSPLRDVSALIRSLYYVAYEEFLTSPQVQEQEQNSLLPFADLWVHYMGGFFMKAYLDEVKGSGFVPDEEADFEVLIQTYLLENALHWFNYEMNHRPGRVIIPLKIIQTIIE